MSEAAYVKISAKGRISLPKNIRRELKMRKDAIFLVHTHKGTITLYRIDPNKANDCFLASLSTLAKDWLSPEDEKAWNNL